ncbi:unnamed protein product [Phytophthora fragariaefolia]|uniref:Unnamed protein product n=1 Tax=Phytophthora fragariaefolia TaxID=1490495 RepID=A0A9W6YGY1_9STRA|nr:unnamed protein product [Phytophthora fragariaefolia]
MTFTSLSIRWAHTGADGTVSPKGWGAHVDQLTTESATASSDLHRRSTMKTIATVVATVLVFVCSPVAALDREKRLRVVSQVHANERVLVTGEEQREKRHGHCVDDGTRNIDPVCASNGKKYLNMNRFEYNKCLIKVEDGEDITIVDLEFCREAMLEDLESEGLV